VVTEHEIPEFDSAAFDDGPWMNPKGCGCLIVGAAVLVLMIRLVVTTGEAILWGW
jgi:hypothetical protein